MIKSIFISHASEDKATIARPLAEELNKIGIVDIWYDEYSLRIGDSLRESIDKGLTQCDHGVVVLSKNFFNKSWPKEELDGLMTKQIASTHKKVILPIWHQVSFDDVYKYSPMLAGKVALDTHTHTPQNIAKKIVDLIYDDRDNDELLSIVKINSWGGYLSLKATSNYRNVNFKKNGLDPEMKFTQEKLEKLRRMVVAFADEETYLKDIDPDKKA